MAQICRAISSQLRHVSTVGKIVKSNISSTCPHSYGELRHTNGWDRLSSLWHPSKFQRVSLLGFVTLPTSLNEGQPTLHLHSVWPSPGLVHCRPICIFRGFCPLTEFCQVQIHFAYKSYVLQYWQRYCTALEHQQWASVKLCGVVQGIWNYGTFVPRYFQSPIAKAR